MDEALRERILEAAGAFLHRNPGKAFSSNRVARGLHPEIDTTGSVIGRVLVRLTAVHLPAYPIALDLYHFPVFDDAEAEGKKIFRAYREKFFGSYNRLTKRWIAFDMSEPAHRVIQQYHWARIADYSHLRDHGK